MKPAEVVKFLKNATEFETKGSIEKAIEELKKAIDISPDDGDIYNRIGDLYIKCNKKSKAIEAFRKGIEAYRKEDYLHNSLALCKKILRYDPDNKEIYAVMGKVLVSMDAKIDAIAYLFEYIETQKEKEDIKKVIETLDYIRELGVKDKDIIERMMQIYKSVGKTDRVALLAESSAERKSPEEIRLVFDRTINVLLVEDDEDDYIITRDMLAESSDIQFKLQWARTCSAGLEYLCSNEFDVCLLDYQLGERTGLDLLRDAIEKGCTIPVILLTGYSGRDVDLEAMYAGAVDYLVKGKIDAVGLERSIRYAIERNYLLKALSDSQEKLRAELVRTVALSEGLCEKQEDLQRLKTHDSLTGMLNRHHFMVTLGLAVSSARRDGRQICLCIGDIDNFKKINYLSGHKIGDQVLKTFAQLIGNSLDKKNPIGRYGDDELSILFPDTTAEEAVKTIEDIRNRFGKTEFKDENGAGFEVTASFGIVEFTGEESQQELLRRADKALNEAKSKGRNRTEIM
ncbi:MAG TPA: diguanylate cyclase [bacterium (Candidatus Stahlbacteria)]|nr:diguanylate cyclase [Candidatus Stahlbacteria bacterium]